MPCISVREYYALMQGEIYGECACSSIKSIFFHDEYTLNIVISNSCCTDTAFLENGVLFLFNLKCYNSNGILHCMA
jgi:hypothetical protein